MRTVIVCLLLVAGPAFSDEADAHYRSGLVLKQQGKLDEAIVELERAIELRGDYAAAEFSVGVVYKSKGNLDKAIPHLERAAALQPKHGQTHASLGVAYYRQKRLDDALRELETACQLDPNLLEAQTSLGALYRMRKEYDKAIPHLEQAVLLDSKDAAALSNLGVVYSIQKQPARAEQYFAQSLAIADRADTRYNLCVALRRQKKNAEALVECQKATALDGKLAAAWYDTGLLLEDQRRAPEAIAAFQRYLELAPAAEKDIVRKRISTLGGPAK